MSQKIIAFVGISGVGKTTFLKKVAKTLKFQHLTAGSLIAGTRAISSGSRDDLRLSNLDENQRLLVQGFDDARDPTAHIVVMDGHVVIHSAEGLVPIDSRVFSCLGVNLIAHLEADPAQIHSNRAMDSSRQRPQLSVHDLHYHQKRSLDEARRVADDLGIELKTLRQDDVDAFVLFLSLQA